MYSRHWLQYDNSDSVIKEVPRFTACLFHYSTSDQIKKAKSDVIQKEHLMVSQTHAVCSLVQRKTRDGAGEKN